MLLKSSASYFENIDFDFMIGNYAFKELINDWKKFVVHKTFPTVQSFTAKHCLSILWNKREGWRFSLRNKNQMASIFFK